MKFSFLSLLLVFSSFVAAQSTNATISGGVTDSAGNFIVNADVEIADDATGIIYSASTNSSGMYLVPILPPGHYHVQVSKPGFKTIIKADVVLNVQSALALNFTLPVGATSESVTVDAASSIINTTDASVSTVIDRKFVENIPLNGRSFQDLISMTPGVVTASPQGNQGAGTVGFTGDFSVNGQRTESNYYTVDGVSANVGAGNGYGTPQAASSGGLAAGTAFGTTQSLASVDELQEFRVTSSTYSAEYGHGPGGQFALLTRSGTNSFHGSAFDYLRNNFFDANDWFNDHYGTPEPALRQNDFGGTLGGPVVLPKLFEGKRNTFFFASYEGLRITQPKAAAIQYVPDVFLRQQAAPALQPILNAYPVQNGIDFGTSANPSLAEFIKAYSLPGSINSTSVRFDHTFLPKLSSFFRFSNTSSSTATRSESVVTALKLNARTYTLGATSQFSVALANDFRLGFSHSEATNAGNETDAFGGAQPINLPNAVGAGQYPFAAPEFELIFPVGRATLVGGVSSNLQSQWNVNDSLTFTSGRHQVKVGVDYRWVRSPESEISPLLVVAYTNASSIETNTALLGGVVISSHAVPIFQHFAAYAQDEWHLRSRLSLSAGLRWELDPPPGAEGGILPYTLLGNIADPASLQLAPRGTPLWATGKYNFSPRLGLAWVAHDASNWQTVFRTGGGVYFDTADEVAGQGYNGIGFGVLSVYRPFSLPFTPSQLGITPSLTPPYTSSTAYAFPAHLQSPYTLQWSAAIEQGLGRSQAFTVSYVAANGRRLVGEQELSVTRSNPSFGNVVYFSNGITSNYQALQLRFQRSIATGISAVASYTWSHSLDYGSNDVALPLQRANSDFDVRHNLQAGANWDLPRPTFNQYADAVLANWGLDARVLMRTAFPVTLDGTQELDSTTGNFYYGGLNYNPAEPVYLYGSQYPGGKAINGGSNNTVNPAFTAPTMANAIGNAPRNFVRGFGLAQFNLAVRRKFAIYKEMSLQFQAEAFNIFNHPAFGYIDSYIGDSTFGLATTSLNGSLGTMAAQYQQGGARSMQFSLRARF
jgi:hypothetical protein